jgi:hypothetical protein
MEETKDIVGETFSAGRYLSQPYECWFYLYPEFTDRIELMQSGFVYEILEGKKGDRCYGIVETSTIETDQSILTAILSRRKGLSTTAIKLRVTRESGLSAPAKDKCKVKIAEPDIIKRAYNIPDNGFPIGIFALPSGCPPNAPPVKLDYKYVLGKEGAHINIGGKSGWAKTALALVLCKAILSDSNYSKNTTVIAFNVKADDLLWPDKENPDIKEEDKKYYELMGVPPDPFQKVNIFAPEARNSEKRETKVDSLREDAKPFSREWADVKEQLCYCIAPEDWNERLEALLVDLIGEDAEEFREIKLLLERWLEEAASPAGRGWAHGHHIETIRKTLRIISSGIMERFKGLVCGTAEPLDVEDIVEPGFFNVIDISRLRAPAQRLVIGKVVSDVQSYLERVKGRHIVYLADELSKFAPKTAREGPIAGIKAILDDIAERGRSIGSILLGIQQYPSQTSDDILGNVATSAYARMKPMELDAAPYRGYSREKKLMIQELNKGFVLVEHDVFKDLVLVRFPKPPCAQSRPLSSKSPHNG